MKKFSDKISELALRYDHQWKHNKELLRNGQLICPDMNQGNTATNEYILTLVCILERQSKKILSKVINVQNVLKDLDPNHYYYPPSTIHITLIGCTPFQNSPKKISKNRINMVLDVCKSEFKKLEKMPSLYIKGLNANRFSIFFQAFCMDGVFLNLKEKIFSQLKVNGVFSINDRKWDEIHLNLVKFIHSDPSNMKYIVKKIDSLRNVEIGMLKIKEVELIITDRLQSPKNTTSIRKISLSN
jgi:hypothetical protein